jgi:DNA polymerase-3 subunit beta
MQLILLKQDMLQALLAVSGAVDKKQSLAILANILFVIKDDEITLIATDLELELQAKVPCQTKGINNSFTAPAKKIIEVIKSLDGDGFVLSWDDKSLTIQSGHSRFKLSTLPAMDFPCGCFDEIQAKIVLARIEFYQLLQSVHFAMAQQDVRVFLNSLFIELEGNELRAVAIDGHRLAFNQTIFVSNNQPKQQVLIPRRAILELLRLMQIIDDIEIEFIIGKNFVKLVTPKFTLITRLTEAKFPQYKSVIPVNHDKFIEVDRELLKRSLSRMIILANEKAPVVKLNIADNSLILSASNHQNEEVSESMEVQLTGDDIQLGVNPYYMLDVLNHITLPQVKISMQSQEQSILLEAPDGNSGQYVIMPTKL